MSLYLNKEHMLEDKAKAHGWQNNKDGKWYIHVHEDINIVCDSVTEAYERDLEAGIDWFE